MPWGHDLGNWNNSRAVSSQDGTWLDYLVKSSVSLVVSLQFGFWLDPSLNLELMIIELVERIKNEMWSVAMIEICVVTTKIWDELCLISGEASTTRTSTYTNKWKMIYLKNSHIKGTNFYM